MNNEACVRNTWILAMAAKRSLTKLSNVREVKFILLALLLEWARYVDADWYDEKLTPAFLRLTYGEVTQMSDVVAYITKIEQELTGHTGVLDENAKEIMHNLDPKQVRYFFNSFTEAQFDEKEDFFPCMVYLVPRYMNDRASWITGNTYVNRLEKELIQITPEMSFYDGCCGTGIGAAMIADGCHQIYLQDLGRDGGFFTTIACIFKGIPAHNISVGDSFFDLVQPDKKFDRIVMEAPPGMKMPRESMAVIPDGNILFPELEDDESLFLRHALARLSREGIAIVLVPAGFLYKSAKKVNGARKELLPYIDAVVYLPGGMGISGSAIASALVVLKLNKRGHSVYMMDAGWYADSEKGQKYFDDDKLADLTRTYMDRAEIENVSAEVSEQQIIDTDCNLTPSRYVKIKEEQDFNTHELGQYLDRSTELFKKLNTIERQLMAMRSMNIE